VRNLSREKIFKGIPHPVLSRRGRGDEGKDFLKAPLTLILSRRGRGKGFF